jgi:hypothetical protein
MMIKYYPYNAICDLVEDETKPKSIRYEALWWKQCYFVEGMRKLARFMTWVECEATTQDLIRRREYFDGGEHEAAFVAAIEAGKLKLVYP